MSELQIMCADAATLKSCISAEGFDVKLLRSRNIEGIATLIVAIAGTAPIIESLAKTLRVYFEKHGKDRVMVQNGDCRVEIESGEIAKIVEALTPLLTSR